MTTFEKITFNGISNCLKMTNDRTELIITTLFGPRIISCTFDGKQNLFKVFEDHLKNPTANKWNNYGGHRLWHAPEISPRTYYPDNEPVPYDIDGETLILNCPEEKINQIKKTIKITIINNTVKVEHFITNCGPWPIELSIWSITVMAQGGTLYVPQEKFVPAGCGEGQALRPTRPTVIWPYTNMADERFTWGEKFIKLRCGDNPQPMKFGLNNQEGFSAYHLNGQWFVKHTPSIPNAKYPDCGCNSEFYTTTGMLEMESLSPLYTLNSGETKSNTEIWEFFNEKPECIKSRE